ncbi:GLIS2-like protein [Mya arenaria]|uniref:GLIS2-like protein n=1 Tax=Mya arenaria TaxID=6604 RepID=A0ABY7E0G5_MYAAR|nr:GLIS2-like protein [Mya arenaria]
MKAEVILRSHLRRNAGKTSGGSEMGQEWMQRESVVVEPVHDHLNPITMVIQEEQYSPSDFINNGDNSNVERKLSLVSSDLNMSPPVSRSPVCCPAPTVLRPIPILPLDSAIYSSPPTYIDNLPPSIAVPLATCQLPSTRPESAIQTLQTPHQYSLPKSPKCEYSSEPELHDCRWLNCDRQFVSMDELVVHVNDHHVRVERADSEYQCKWGGCPRRGKGFNASVESEKPYICPFEGCNKAYSNSSDRFKHVRTHQEDKPYICKMQGCNKRYTDPSSLRKHVRTHGHYVKDSSLRPGLASLQTDSSLSPTHSSITELQRPFSSKVTAFSSSNVIVPLSLLTTMPEGGRGLLPLSGPHSNPLLSSTIVPLTRTPLSTLPDRLPIDFRALPISLATHLDKGDRNQGQESPLDLSTNPSPIISYGQQTDTGSFHSPHITRYEGVPQDIIKWEILHMPS